jgi:Cof subfamily protein (haloacid dehalogenase superfamily)
VLSPRTLAAIRAVRAAGIPVIIATGRMFRSLAPHLAEAGITEPAICYQGAAVVDTETGRFLLHVPIPVELARRVIEAVSAEGFALNCYVDDHLYVAETTDASRRYADFQGLPVTEVGSLAEWLAADPTKLVAIGDPDALAGLRARLHDRFADELHITTSLPHFLELGSPDVTKGTGLAFVAARMGIALDRMVAFGDGENDIELLERAGFGIAVENAHPLAKAQADWICPSAEEDGVAQVLEVLLDSRA